MYGTPLFKGRPVSVILSPSLQRGPRPAKLPDQSLRSPEFGLPPDNLAVCLGDVEGNERVRIDHLESHHDSLNYNHRLIVPVSIPMMRQGRAREGKRTDAKTRDARKPLLHGSTSSLVAVRRSSEGSPLWIQSAAEQERRIHAPESTLACDYPLMAIASYLDTLPQQSSSGKRRQHEATLSSRQGCVPTPGKTTRAGRVPTATGRRQLSPP